MLTTMLIHGIGLSGWENFKASSHLKALYINGQAKIQGFLISQQG